MLARSDRLMSHRLSDRGSMAAAYEKLCVQLVSQHRQTISALLSFQGKSQDVAWLEEPV